MVELMVVVQIWVADLEIREVVVRHAVVEMDLKGPVANCPLSLEIRKYLHFNICRSTETEEGILERASVQLG
ncbi:hypothetical protein Tco_0999563 [Tanacetum coccineum]